MRYRCAVVTVLLLAGCGRQQDMRAQPEKLNAFDVTEPAPAAVAAPQIAYSYTLSYRLDDARIAGVQTRQVALCTALGAARCRIVKTTISSGSGGVASDGETDLLIDARIAAAFQQRLDAVASDAGGAVAARGTTAQDVTKQLIDTDARVRAKQALADRLLRLIGSANGKVGDLVAAEQAFSETQEALDAARSLQANLQQRVAMSELDIGYVARSGDSVWAPVRRSVGDAGQMLGTSIGALIAFVVVALPWIAVGGALIWLARRVGVRWPFRRRRAPVTQA